MDSTKPKKETLPSAGHEEIESRECLVRKPKPLLSSPLTPGHPFREGLRLKGEFERIRLDCIWTDLGVCLALAAVAKTRYDMGSREHAERALAAAEKGYSDMLRFFSQAKGLRVEREREFQAKFNRLREELDGLQRLRGGC